MAKKTHSIKTVESLAKKTGISTTYINGKLSELTNEGLAIKKENRWHFRRDAVNYLVGLSDKQIKLYHKTLEDITADAGLIKTDNARQFIPKLSSDNLAIKTKLNRWLFKPEAAQYIIEYSKTLGDLIKETGLSQKTIEQYTSELERDKLAMQININTWRFTSKATRYLIDKNLDRITATQLSRESGVSTSYIKSIRPKLEAEKFIIKQGQKEYFRSEAINYILGLSDEQIKTYSKTLDDLIKETDFSKKTIEQYIPELERDKLAIQTNMGVWRFKAKATRYLIEKNRNFITAMQLSVKSGVSTSYIKSIRPKLEAEKFIIKQGQKEYFRSEAINYILGLSDLPKDINSIKELASVSGMSIPHINNKLKELEERELGVKIGGSWSFKPEAVNYLTGMSDVQMKIFTKTMQDIAQITGFSKSTIYQYLPELYNKGLAINPRPRLVLFDPSSVSFITELMRDKDRNAPRKRRKMKSISTEKLAELESKRKIPDQIKKAIDLYVSKKYTIDEISDITGISRQGFYNYLNQITE